MTRQVGGCSTLVGAGDAMGGRSSQRCRRMSVIGSRNRVSVSVTAGVLFPQPEPLGQLERAWPLIISRMGGGGLSPDRSTKFFHPLIPSGQLANGFRPS